LSSKQGIPDISPLRINKLSTLLKEHCQGFCADDGYLVFQATEVSEPLPDPQVDGDDKTVLAGTDMVPHRQMND
jgi:hypothetical protein